MRIALVAGEASGDQLGANLITALKSRYHTAEFVGVGGPLMQKAGCYSLYPMETLSVMGLLAPLLRLPSLIRCFYGLLWYFKKNPPDIFIGIDSPDFTLRLEKKLKKRGIKTLHWVSPTLWAWRSGRIEGIRKAVDTMAVLFPFEEAYYQKRGISAVFTGHPLADKLPLVIDDKTRAECAAQLGLNPEHPILGILPGSRSAEVHYLAKDFLHTARIVQEYHPNLQCIIPAANTHRFDELQRLCADYSDLLNIKCVLGQAREVMMASHALLLASGTVTLEAMFCKTPMVVAYKMSDFTYWIAKKCIRVPFISLPNILAYFEFLETRPNGIFTPWIREYIQDEVDPEQLASDLLQLFKNSGAHRELTPFIKSCTYWHQVMKQNAAEKASAAVTQLLS